MMSSEHNEFQQISPWPETVPILGDDVESITEIWKELDLMLMESPYYFPSDSKGIKVERYSDKYRHEQNYRLEDLPIDKSSLPEELTRTYQRTPSKKASAINNKAWLNIVATESEKLLDEEYEGEKSSISEEQEDNEWEQIEDDYIEEYYKSDDDYDEE